MKPASPSIIKLASGGRLCYILKKENMIGLVKIYQEQRRFPRVALNSEVKFQIRQSNKFGLTCCRDISEGGVRILTEEFIPLGTTMKLEIILKNALKCIDAIAEVVWLQRMLHSERYQMGLRFREIADAYRNDVHEFVEAHQI